MPASRQEIQELKAGDIGAVIGLKLSATGDTLCESKRSGRIGSAMTFPEPVISVVIRSQIRSRSGEDDGRSGSIAAGGSDGAGAH